MWTTRDAKRTKRIGGGEQNLSTVGVFICQLGVTRAVRNEQTLDGADLGREHQ